MHSLPAEIVDKIIKESILSKPNDFKNLAQVSTLWNSKCTLFKPVAQQLLVQNELKNLKKRLKEIENDQSTVLPQKTCAINEIDWHEREKRASSYGDFQTIIKLAQDNYIKKCQVYGDAGAFELVKMHFSKLSKAKFNSIGLEEHEFYKSFFDFNERSLTKGFALLSFMNKNNQVEKLLSFQANPFIAELLQEEEVPPTDSCCPKL